jgi:uncharacterized membrane protein YhaH (DUF805 family)
LDLGVDSGWTGVAAYPKANLAWYALLNAVLSYSAAAAAGKRFHDRGKTGWLAPLAAATLLGLDEIVEQAGAGLSYATGLLLHLDTSAMSGSQAAALAAILVQSGILLWLTIELGVLRGAAEANSYGPPPAHGMALAG